MWILDLPGLFVHKARLIVDMSIVPVSQLSKGLSKLGNLQKAVTTHSATGVGLRQYVLI